MTSIIAPLTVLGLFTIAIVAVGTGTAFAASPAYCALYAREYATQFSDGSGTNQRIQDQAYYRCLNLDEDPEFPVTSAYFGATAGDIISDSNSASGSLPIVEEGDTSVDEIAVPADDPPVAKVKPTRVAAKGTSRSGHRGSGLEAWTPEWTEWCTAHYKSFNPETGFVRSYSGRKKLCP